MADKLIAFWLSIATIVQASWFVFYLTRYQWRDTRLGSVWLTKGLAFGMLWPLLLLDGYVEVNDWIWALLVGPLVAVGTSWWFIETVRVARDSEKKPPIP